MPSLRPPESRRLSPSLVAGGGPPPRPPADLWTGLSKDSGGGEATPHHFSPISDSMFCNRGFCLFVKKKQTDSRPLQAPWPFYSGKLSCEQLFFFFFFFLKGGTATSSPTPVTTTVRPGGLVRTVTVNEPGAGGKGAQQCFNVKMCEKDKKKNSNFFKVGEKHPSTLTPLYQVN